MSDRDDCRAPQACRRREGQAAEGLGGAEHPAQGRPAYTTIQTTVYRLEAKQALRRLKKIGNAHIFEPIVARDVTRHRLLDEILSFFGGRPLPMMAQLGYAIP